MGSRGVAGGTIDTLSHNPTSVSVIVLATAPIFHASPPDDAGTAADLAIVSAVNGGIRMSSSPSELPSHARMLRFSVSACVNNGAPPASR